MNADVQLGVLDIKPNIENAQTSNKECYHNCIFDVQL